MKTPKSKFSLAAILLLAFCAGAVSNSYLEVALRSLRNRVAQTSQQAPEPKPKRNAQPKHYTNRDSVIQHLIQFSSRSETSITFLGDSHIEECEWRDLWTLHVDNHNPDVSIRNRGVSCSTTKQVLERLKDLSKQDQGLLIIMAGVNDISLGVPPEETIANFSEMLDTCEEHKLNALVCEILPVSQSCEFLPKETNSRITTLNQSLNSVCGIRRYASILTLHDDFCDTEGQLRSELSDDGLHLNINGYLLWLKKLQPALKPYLKG